MTLDEFKFIFFWEYGHRMMGRMLGFAFAGPLVYFGARGMIPRHLYPRMALLFGLGGSQGLIGWWMVKSGLTDDVLESNKEIRVSPYRLATHLSMAFTTYGCLLWTSLEILKPTSATVESVITRNGAASITPKLLGAVKQIRDYRWRTWLWSPPALRVPMSPAMTPEGIQHLPQDGRRVGPRGHVDSGACLRNIVENTATVQFDHRVLALATLSSITAMFVTAKRAASGVVWKQILPRYSQMMLHSAAGMAAVQVGLGISTLLLYVPTHLAATHQFGSLVLLTFSTAALHSLKFAKVISVHPQWRRQIQGGSRSRLRRRVMRIIGKQGVAPRKKCVLCSEMNNKFLCSSYNLQYAYTMNNAILRSFSTPLAA